MCFVRFKNTALMKILSRKSSCGRVKKESFEIKL